MDWFKASLGVAVILVAHHLIKTDRIGFSAENYGLSRKDKKFDEYTLWSIRVNDGFKSWTKLQWPCFWTMR